MSCGILNRGNTHGFHGLYAIFCAEKQIQLKLQFLPYSSPFFYLAFDKKSVKGKAIPALFFMMSSKPQELKPLD